MNKIYLGLGNPGEEYAETYHNAGKSCVLDILSHYGLSFQNVSGKHFTYAKKGSDVFVVPSVFMNESGIAALEAIKYFDSDAKNLCVLHDDSDLAIGTYKYINGGSSAGHHGIESIIAVLGNPEFLRVRIGIRNQAEPVRKKAGDFVLKKVSKTDRGAFYGVFTEIRTKLIENDTPPSDTTID
ncbi:MAG: aminoacyl-tRNA hydrolase [Candidatus Liptonbacteria bacterium]